MDRFGREKIIKHLVLATSYFCPKGLSSPQLRLTSVFGMGEKWVGTHFARLIENFCECIHEVKSPMSGQFL